MQLRLLATILLTAGLGVACGDSSGGTSYDIEMGISDRALNADGSNGATLSITVLDGDGGPPPIGSVAFVQCQDSSGDPSLWIGDGDEPGEGQIPLDTLGIGQVDVRCSGDDGSNYEVQCLAAFEGATGFLQPFTCETAQES